MSFLKVLLARLRSFVGGNQTDRLAEELALHAEMLAADYQKRGMTEAEAGSAARRELGNRTSVEEQYREQSGLPLIEIFWQDLRFAIRSLRRNPVFAISSLTTLTVGLSGMITVLCVVSAFLWTPLPYPAPDRLTALKEVDPRGSWWTFSEPTWLDLAQKSRSLEAVSACRLGSSTLTGAGEPEALHAALVTPSFFAMFGVRVLAGRVFQSPQGQLVISRRLWERKWRKNPSVVGQAVRVDGASYLITGVAEPPGDLLPEVDVMLPLAPQAAGSRSAHEIEAFGRRRTGVSERQLQAELSALAARIARDYPGKNAGWGMKALPLSAYLTGPRTTRMLWMILGGVALVWLLACSNVAGLQLARRIARREEIATRQALGASRARLLAQGLTESAVLAVAGTILGLGIADWTLHLLARFGADSIPRLAYLHLDAKTIAATLGCLLVSLFLFGISPQSGNLAGGGRRGVSAQDRGRDAWMIAQVAFATVLILCSGLLFESFLRLQAVNPGFDPARLLTTRIDTSVRGNADWQRAALLREATAEVEGVPEVAAAGASNVAPFSGSGTANRFRLEQESGTGNYHSAAWRAVTPGFFRAVNLPLKRGRLFTDADRDGSLEVVIVSESMARQFWPKQNVIGKRLLWGSSGNPKTIVGVVGDMRDLTVEAAPVATMFRPFAQLSNAQMTMLIRLKTDNPDAHAAIRKAIWAVEPNTPVELQTVRKRMSASLLPQRGALQVMTAFASLATLIAGLGLYGLVSYRVTQRRLEIGIRLALGASPNAVRWAIQKRSMKLAAWGLLIGLPAAYAGSRLITSLLYQTRPNEMSAYAGVCLLFMAVALLASYGPARRAARVETASIMRCE
ncbi:MAG TPA: ABC transporter permease [Bryobacteraceae bacterium]|nr:ABC transporter permease [Bryobacteraceae bacterium]